MTIIDPAVLALFRNKRKCELCGQPTPGGCEPHHAYHRGIGGGSRLDHEWNLIGLCGPGWDKVGCHRLAHDGNVPRQAIWQAIGKRYGVSGEVAQERVWELLRAR